jgi:hypothetical protein
MRVSSLAVWLLVLALPAAAVAQEPDTAADGDAAQTGRSQGPMTLERVQSGWTIAPEFKATDLNGFTATLAGAHGGWVYDNTFLFGGAAYWMTNGSRQRDLAYGGFLFKWLQRADRTVGYSGGALVGVGSSELPGTITYPQPLRFDRDGRRSTTITTATRNVVFHDRFFVFEPQADVLVRLSRLLRLDGGVGYRLTDRAYDRDHQLRGVTGSVSLVVGGFSSDHQ